MCLDICYNRVTIEVTSASSVDLQLVDINSFIFHLLILVYFIQFKIKYKTRSFEWGGTQNAEALKQVTTDFRGHNWVHFAYRPQCTVTLNSNFAFLNIYICLMSSISWESVNPNTNSFPDKICFKIIGIS